LAITHTHTRTHTHTHTHTYNDKDLELMQIVPLYRIASLVYHPTLHVTNDIKTADFFKWQIFLILLQIFSFEIFSGLIISIELFVTFP
jgi:hypothetical protein